MFGLAHVLVVCFCFWGEQKSFKGHGLHLKFGIFVLRLLFFSNRISVYLSINLFISTFGITCIRAGTHTHAHWETCGIFTTVCLLDKWCINWLSTGFFYDHRKCIIQFHRKRSFHEQTKEMATQKSVHQWHFRRNRTTRWNKISIHRRQREPMGDGARELSAEI